MLVPAMAPSGCPVKRSWVTGPAVMLNVTLVATVKPVALADRVYPVPLLSMLRVLKDAAPATAATVAVPDRAPDPGLVPMAIVTFPVKPGTALPTASCAVTTIAAIGVPATVVVGCVVHASFAAAPTATANGAVVASRSPFAEA